VPNARAKAQWILRVVVVERGKSVRDGDKYELFGLTESSSQLPYIGLACGISETAASM
jgi:hypothetical protein